MPAVSSAFSRSLKSLEVETAHWSVVRFALVACVVAAWILWTIRADVSVYEVSESARLEADQAIHPIEAEAAGQVVTVQMAVGRLVHRGDLLVQLQADRQQLQVAEEQARHNSILPQVQALRSQLESEERALQEMRSAATAALAQTKAQSNGTSASARFAQEEAERLARLHASGLITEMSFLRAQVEAENQQAVAEAARFAIARLLRENQTAQATQLAHIEELKREMASLQGDLNTSTVTIRRLQEEIHNREIRAPVAGRIGEAVDLRAGAVVHEGDRLATIVREGELNVVGTFSAATALGRVQVGQSGRVRLSGFPWIEYGTIPATVTSVASEARNGQIRVELSLQTNDAMAIPLQHGLPAEVEVELEHRSPARLLLRALGQWTGAKSSLNSNSRSSSNLR
jgi:multidrug resistance efflux pump